MGALASASSKGVGAARIDAREARRLHPSGVAAASVPSAARGARNSRCSAPVLWSGSSPRRVSARSRGASTSDERAPVARARTRRGQRAAMLGAAMLGRGHAAETRKGEQGRCKTPVRRARHAAAAIFARGPRNNAAGRGEVASLSRRRRDRLHHPERPATSPSALPSKSDERHGQGPLPGGFHSASDSTPSDKSCDIVGAIIRCILQRASPLGHDCRSLAIVTVTFRRRGGPAPTTTPTTTRLPRRSRSGPTEAGARGA